MTVQCGICGKLCHLKVSEFTKCRKAKLKAERKGVVLTMYPPEHQKLIDAYQHLAKVMMIKDDRLSEEGLDENRRRTCESKEALSKRMAHHRKVRRVQKLCCDAKKGIQPKYINKHRLTEL